MHIHKGFPRSSVVKNPPTMQMMQETAFNPWDGKIPWRRAWQPALENPMDRGAW